MKNSKTIGTSVSDSSDEEELDCVPGTDIPKNSVGASNFDKPMTDEEREKAIEIEMPHCAPAVKAWVRQNKSPVSDMWLFEDDAKRRNVDWENLDERDPWNCQNPLFGYETFWENVPRDSSTEARYAEFVGNHTEQEVDAGRKLEEIIMSDLGFLDTYPVLERAKEIASKPYGAQTKPYGAQTNSKNACKRSTNIDGETGETYNPGYSLTSMASSGTAMSCFRASVRLGKPRRCAWLSWMCLVRAARGDIPFLN